MNYDLAIMALDGLMRSRMTATSDAAGLTIEGSADAFKHLARLCLLLGGDAVAGEAFELQAGTHLAAGSTPVTLRRT